MSDIYKRRLKAIRPFVNFNYDLRKTLTAAQKGKITRYYNEIIDRSSGPHYVYRPRSKKNLKLAKSYTDSQLPGIKVAFIPTHEKVRISFARGKMVVKGENVTETYLPVDKELLIENPELASKKAIKGRKEKAFKIQAGEYEITGTYEAEFLHAEMARLTEKYSNNEKNNFVGNWLHGIKAYKFDNQKDYRDYSKAKQAAKEKRVKARKKRKRTTNPWRNDRPPQNRVIEFRSPRGFRNSKEWKMGQFWRKK